MKVTEGIGWVLVGTGQFDETVAFFRDFMGLDITEEGVPAIETQFARYAQIRMPNGVVLEIVEPVEALRRLYSAPVLSITVDDLAQARRELEAEQIELVAPIFDSREGWAWTYFRAPDGNVYQIQGPYAADQA